MHTYIDTVSCSEFLASPYPENKGGTATFFSGDQKWSVAVDSFEDYRAILDYVSAECQRRIDRHHQALQTEINRVLAVAKP